VFLRAGRYDVIHIHNLSTFGALVAVAGWLRRTPVMMKLPNVGRLGIPGLREYVLGDGVLLMLKCVSAFVAMSEESVRELVEIRTPERKIFKIVNGINLRAFDEASEGADRDNKDIKVIFTGRLVQNKGVEDLLEAWSGLQEGGLLESADAQVRLHIVGDGPDKKRLQEITAKLQVQDTVIFEGYRSDIPRLLLQSSIFVLPSYSEGNSNSILEAMSAGLPVVSTDIGGTSLLMGPEASEYVVETGDIDRMATCLKSLIGNQDLREMLSANLRRRVESHFDIGVVAKAYCAAYSELRRSRSADMTPLASDVFRQEM
jgi:glycosyltransferase involved in cell wall biosynthesis